MRALAAVVAAAALPFLVPQAWAVPRALLTVYAVVFAIKVLELTHGRFSDPAMHETAVRRLVWLLIPPDTRWPRDPPAARSVVLEGRRRMGRGLGKGLGLVLLLAVNAWDISRVFVLGTAWAMLVVYSTISGAADLVSGLVMQSGIFVAESFDAPMLARSPREFWGRRWNRFVHRAAARNLFLQFGGRRHPNRATFVVFSISGLMHEYVVAANAQDRWAHVGWMTAFFAIHGLAVVAEMALDRRRGPRPLLSRHAAICLHLVWLLATAPLFLLPLHDGFSIFDWRLW